MFVPVPTQRRSICTCSTSQRAKGSQTTSHEVEGRRDQNFDPRTFSSIVIFCIALSSCLDTSECQPPHHIRQSASTMNITGISTYLDRIDVIVLVQ